MEEFRSLDGEFTIKVSRHTLEAEEIPTIIAEIGAIMLNLSKAYDDLHQGDISGLAGDFIRIYESVKKIKEEIED